MNGIIYIITNKINGKKYVGQTRCSFNERWKEHLRKAKKTKTPSVFQKALLKYGKDNFISEEHIFDIELLDEKEKEYISELKTKVSLGYNLTDGGGGAKGYRHSEEIKWKFKTNLGKKFTKEHREKISLGRMGKKHSEETKKKISDLKIGKKIGPRSEKTKRKMSKSSKKGWKKHFNVYVFVDPKGKEYIVKDGFRKFCNIHHLCRRLMYYILEGKVLTHKGWTVQYYEK